MNRKSNLLIAATRNLTPLLFTVSLWLASASTAFGYGALTHQATIDAVWEDTFQPLLQKRFPTATDKDLRAARAYAYGGSIIQDLGYYQFSSQFFSDLVHYVRSGDFVVALLHEARDANEYAFALGALAHYVGDNHGHAIAVNRAVPSLYPHLHAQHGHEVTYADDPIAHLQTEFAFDVWQVARGCYAPQSFHRAIGFKVAKPVLERAFAKTYGVEMKEIFVSVDFAIHGYRRAVSQLIPRITRVAWERHKNELQLRTNATCEMTIDEDEKRERPGGLDKTLALLLRVVPKVGKLKALAFKLPSAEAEALFTTSFQQTLADYRALLQQTQHGQLTLANNDFDTGRPARVGEYKLADQTYAKLIAKLAQNGERQPVPGLREDILTFYGAAGSVIAAQIGKPVGAKPAGLLTLESGLNQ
jgi:hypothetical protein